MTGPRAALTRTRFVALLIAAPAIITAITLGIYMVTGPAKPPADGSLADAIVQGDVEQAYALLHAGHDPDAPIAFRHPELTAGREVSASPLLIAVAARRDNVVGMLLSAGAHPGLAQNKPAVCLAKATDDEIAGMFDKLSSDARTVACPPLRHNAASPLLAAIDGEGRENSTGN